MGCSASSAPCEQPQEKPLTPRDTEPPPPPLTTMETTTDDTFTFPAPLYPALASIGPMFAGIGAGSSAKPGEAARDALKNAVASLQVATGAGGSPKPSLAIIACSGVADDAEEVRCELVRALPDALLHGASSVSTLFASCTQSAGSRESCSGKTAADGVGCLLLQVPEGSFATAWDDTGDVLYAAKWLQEQMPDAQAIIMAVVPGQEDRAVAEVQSVFPGIPVYGRSAVKATHWVTMSHLGSSEHGVSLVGIGVHVGFGAADAAASSEDPSASFLQAYEAAMAAGCLKKATAGIVTCRGPIADLSFLERLKERTGNVPLLGVACSSHTQSLNQDPSIGIMLLGERDTQQEVGSRDPLKMSSGGNSEDDAASGSTAWPNSPATDISNAESGGTLERDAFQPN